MNTVTCVSAARLRAKVEQQLLVVVKLLLARLKATVQLHNCQLKCLNALPQALHVNGSRFIG
jgi:hypothetical protein